MYILGKFLLPALDEAGLEREWSLENKKVKRKYAFT